MRKETAVEYDKERVLGGEFGGLSFSQRGESYLFGPDSTSRIKFPRGLHPAGGKLMKIGELIAQGKTDYIVKKLIEAEYPGKAVSRQTIQKMRIVVEAERGPILCRCGKPVNHADRCQFKSAASFRNRALSPEAVREIRADYGTGKCTLLKLAQKYGVSESTISEVIRKEYHKPVPLRLAQFKIKMYLGQLEKVKSPILRLIDARMAAPISSPKESALDEKLKKTLRCLEQTIVELQESSML